MAYFMKSPCLHCPFRRDVKPYWTPERGEQLALATKNPYNSFSCHKTTVSDEEFGGDGFDMVVTEKSLECAGFLTMQINNGANCPDGFEPSDNVYDECMDMIKAYEDQE